MRHHPSRFAILLSIALTVAGCSGDGAGVGQFSMDAAVGGIWQGTTTINGQGDFGLFGIVAEDGRAFFVQDDGIMYWGTVTSRINNITSAMDGAALFGGQFSDGSLSGSGSISGTIRARASVVADSTFTTRYGTRTASTLSLSYAPLYDDDSSLAVVAGNYSDADGFTDGVLNIASNGDLFLQDSSSSCVINGRVSIIDSAYNAYDIQFSYSSCTADDTILNGVNFTGLAFYDRDPKQVLAFVVGTVEGRPYPDLFVFDRL